MKGIECYSVYLVFVLIHLTEAQPDVKLIFNNLTKDKTAYILFVQNGEEVISTIAPGASQTLIVAQGMLTFRWMLYIYICTPLFYYLWRLN